MQIIRRAYRSFADAPKRYRRVVAGNSYDMRLDSLRFLAVIAVVVCHILNHTVVYGPFQQKAYHPAWFAVYNLFQGISLLFVLSSFLLASYLFRVDIRLQLKDYFSRRFSRIVPAYWLVLTICLLVHLFYLKDVGTGEGLWHYLGSMLFASQLVSPHAHPFLMPIGWTLEIELHYYLLLPFFLLFYKRFPRAGRLVAVFLLLAWNALMGQFDWFRHTSVLFQLPYFAAGILLADLLRSRPQLQEQHLLPPWLTRLTGLSCILLLVIADWYYVRWNGIKLDAAPVLLFVLMLLVLTQGLFHRLMHRPWIAFIGSMGYSIYLVHMLVISSAGKLLLHWRITDHLLPNFLLQTVLLCPLVIGAGFLFYRYVEYPLMRRGVRK